MQRVFAVARTHRCRRGHRSRRDIPKGTGADYGTKTLQKPLVGCVFAGKGLIAGLSLERSKINKIDG
jgi:hypothetical protein